MAEMLRKLVESKQEELELTANQISESENVMRTMQSDDVDNALTVAKAREESVQKRDERRRSASGGGGSTNDGNFEDDDEESEELVSN